MKQQNFSMKFFFFFLLWILKKKEFESLVFRHTIDTTNTFLNVRYFLD